jgi:hypothetical protein
LAIINEKYRVKNGLRVDNSQKVQIVEVNESSLEVNGATASDIPLIVKSNESQAADLQRWNDEDDQTLAYVNKDGKLYAQELETESHVVIGGNLTVNGTTTTINSIISSVDDPVILLGGDTEPESDDNKDRGVEFRWHNGIEAKTGFFGFQDATGKFTFIPDATNDGEIFSGNTGNLILNDIELDGNLTVNGGDISTLSTTFNLVDDIATTVNFAGAATDVQIGSSTGTTTINNDVDIAGDRLSSQADIFTLLDTQGFINIGSAATYIDIGASGGTTQVHSFLDVDGDLNIDGGDLTVGTVIFNLANTTATAVNFAGDATDIQIGSSTGTTNINNNLDVDGDLNVDGGDFTVSTSIFNLANTTATTVNFAGAATDIQIGSSTGTTNVNNNLDVDGDVNIDGGDLTASSSLFNLLHTPNTINFGAAATDIQIGSATGTTNINNNLDVDGDVSIDGGDLNATTTLFNLLSSPTTIDFGLSATDIQVGANTGTTTVRNNLTVEDTLTITGPTTNFNPPTPDTAPFTVGINAYDVLVTGLNADKLDSQTGSWYQARENHTGTQLHTTISDWEEAVEDTVAPMFVHSQQSGIVAQYNDETGRILLTVAGGGGSGQAVDFGLLYWMGV